MLKKPKLHFIELLHILLGVCYAGYIFSHCFNQSFSASWNLALLTYAWPFVAALVITYRFYVRILYLHKFALRSQLALTFIKPSEYLVPFFKPIAFCHAVPCLAAQSVLFFASIFFADNMDIDIDFILASFLLFGYSVAYILFGILDSLIYFNDICLRKSVVQTNYFAPLVFNAMAFVVVFLPLIFLFMFFDYIDFDYGNFFC